MVKIKSTEGNVCSQNHINNLLISATAGSIIGATTALLFAPKSGRKLRNDLYRTYEDLSDKGQDLVDDLVETGQKVAGTASEYADNIKDSASNIFGKSNNNSHSGILMGAIGGGILGLAAVLALLNNRDQDHSKESLLHKINKAGKFAKKNSVHWIETARDILETITNKSNESTHHHNGSSYSAEEEEHEDSTLHNVMDLASAGYKVWQNMKKRR